MCQNSPTTSGGQPLVPPLALLALLDSLAMAPLAVESLVVESMAVEPLESLTVQALEPLGSRVSLAMQE